MGGAPLIRVLLKRLHHQLRPRIAPVYNGIIQGELDAAVTSQGHEKRNGIHILIRAVHILGKVRKRADICIGPAS